MPAHAPPSPGAVPAAKRIRKSSPGRLSLEVGIATADAMPDTAETSPADDHSAGGGANGGSSGANGSSAGAGAGSSSGSGGGSSKANQSSNFRNVSACNRCRLRKNRCDQRLPSCVSCEKAGVACVGYDPITKKEIPRSYVYYLETRVEQLEAILREKNIAFPPADELEHSSTMRSVTESARASAFTDQSKSGLSSSGLETGGVGGGGHGSSSASESRGGDSRSARQQANDEDDNGVASATSRIQKLVARANQTRDQGTSNPRHLGAATGVSFARVVFAAVQSSVSDQKSISDKGSIRPYKPIAGNGSVGAGTSMRDSFFGLHTKPTIHPAVFPDRELGQKLVSLYFEHANPQIPVLHREDFMQMFEQAYATEGRVRGPKELYMLNMVFAIGGGIIVGDHGKSEDADGEGGEKDDEGGNHGRGGTRSRSKQCQPEEYHASAIVHLEACLSNSGGGLEELQAVLLLANFALLRPVPPGLWYIIGVAVRLAVDLGLYYEDGKDVETGLSAKASANEALTRERGRREYVRDLRRRLWWCTYSFDRLVSVCVGRPPGVSDLVMTTEFPSLLDDRYITPNGFLREEHDPSEPTYKRVAYHYFHLRVLQSEIIQVLQYQQAQVALAASTEKNHPLLSANLPSPFLAKFDSFRTWRIDIDRRLYKWKTTMPPKPENGVAFSTEFLELNYWQCIIMLYRQSLSVPPMFEGEYHTSKEVNNPTPYQSELREDEDRVYLKVAEAGQRILRLYRQLHLIGLVNYTYLATHHLFMAGISYLYAIWHSPIVRSRLSMDEVDFTILAATSVFSDLIDKCPPAEACRDAFDRTAKATIKMANSTGGFGQTASFHAYQSRRQSRGAADGQRLDWGFSPSDVSPAMSTTSAVTVVGGSNAQHGNAQQNVAPSASHRHQQQQRQTNDPSRPRQYQLQLQQHQQQQQQLSQQRYDQQPVNDGYGGGGPMQKAAHMSSMGDASRSYRGAGGAGLPGSLKMEQDGFSLMQTAPNPPCSTASSYEMIGTPDGSAVDPSSMLTSPVLGGPQQQQQQGMSPMSGSLQGTPVTPTAPAYLNQMQQQHQQHQRQHAQQPQQANAVYTPNSQTFSDLQGMEFLQELNGNNGDGTGPMVGGGGGLMGDQQMDFGLNFGWEGMHHDFNDGQQLDLFDGFFFGGQQGGSGGGSGGGNPGGM
ncbi:hypothetical protein SBRCBS47491_008656 [Sporothrix bragantina]|uniref:Zn(2)-C6 fungal-type domain-containing protein n=1 Tax=Sporothrix bragantina TaxID=671064 RepID=A0ABP0CR45_9PEZI